MAKILQFQPRFISHVVRRDMHTLHVRHTPPKDGSEINPHDLMLGQEYARFNKKGKYKKFSRLGPKKR